jgi:hypothetical protein
MSDFNKTLSELKEKQPEEYSNLIKNIYSFLATQT